MTRCASRPLVLVLLGLAAACGDDGPPMAPTASIPAVPVSLRVVALEIAGPESVPPGETAQLTATARLSDGTSRDVTSAVVWESHNPTVLLITPSGLLTATPARGESQVTARYTALPEQSSGAGWASREVLVLPAGTFRVYGAIRDGGVLVPGVRVQVTDGPAAGLAVDAIGFYRLYGVWGVSEIQVTKSGYHTHTMRLDVTRHETLDVELVPLVPRDDVTGSYQLVWSASPSCGDLLPADVRARTYAAVITQDLARLTVTLSGARFVVDVNGSGNRFSGAVEPGRVVFNLIAPGQEEHGVSVPSVLEELPPANYLTLYGSAVLSPHDTGYTGTLNGSALFFEWDGGVNFRPLAECRAADHRFDLVR